MTIPQTHYLTACILRYLINYEYSKDLNINSMGRRIRTRLYFTSESHLHTVLNVFRFAQMGDGKRRLLSEHGSAILNGTPELCYLTQVVMRVFEDSRWAMEDPRRFRVEILFSPGATATPMHMKELDREQDQSRFDTAPLQLISREGLTCREVEDFFEQAIVAGRSDEDSVGHASTSAEGGKQAKVKKDKKVSLPTASLVPEPEMAVALPVPTPISLVEKVASEELVTTFPAVIETVNPPDVLPPHLDELSVKTDPLSPDDTYPLEVAVTGRSLGLEVDDDNQGDRQVSDTADGDMEDNAKGDMDTQESIEIVGGGGDGDKDPTGTDNDKAARKLISRKYFWGTIAVTSFAVGLTCIVVALTLSQDARRTRRWSTRRY
jgi:hypothetical protein